MRVFLALELPAGIIAYLKGITDRLAKRTEGVRWVKNEGIHITIKFLGEREEALVQTMEAVLAPIGSQFAPVNVCLGQLDAFPSTRRARVIVVRLNRGVREIQAMFSEIEERLTKIDMVTHESGEVGYVFDREAPRTWHSHSCAGRVEGTTRAPVIERETRDLTPHITIGRRKVPGPFPDSGDMMPIEEREFNIENLVLYKSTLTSGGAIYEPIWKIKIGGSKQ
jgi:2'-5' RNA ligase